MNTVDTLPDEAQARARLAEFAATGAPTLRLPGHFPVAPAVGRGRDPYHEVRVTWDGRFALTLWTGTRKVTFHAREIKTDDPAKGLAWAAFALEVAKFGLAWERRARETLGRDAS